MANNPYVNKVQFGNQTIMDISDTDASESDVANGKVFYKGNGQRSTGTAVTPDISNCYQTTDTAETTIDDADYFPFYDTSATAKRKTLWSNIKSVLKTYFDEIYQSALTLPLSTSNGGTGNATGYIRTGKKSGSNASTGTTIEGNNNTATAQYAHAEGSSNSASGASAHVEGTGNYATGNSSHAEGTYNRADGAQSHAQGSRCEADGDYSHTGGYYLNAGYQSQTVVGEYNDNKANTVFEVGNGTSTNARSNALEVYRDGHINVNGDIQKNGLDALETIVATSYADNGTVTFTGVDDTVGGTHMYSVGFDVTSSSTQKAPYAELQSISGEGTNSMTLTYKTNADNGSSSNKNAFLIRKIL